VRCDFRHRARITSRYLTIPPEAHAAGLGSEPFDMLNALNNEIDFGDDCNAAIGAKSQHICPGP
jgi:hypothetical protein